MKEILCNKYEVLKPIAEGGMGSVLLVKDLHLNKLAAVKVNKPLSLMTKKSSILQEREVLKQLFHPALPQIIDFFEEEGKEYLVMEYVEGITLEQYLRRFGRVEVGLAVTWAVELTEVLSYLHSQNPPIIYRDLKPANIMIRPDGRIKLIDFGAAAVSAFGCDKEEFLMGTPGYSAPEQWKDGCAGKQSDIYALGAVMHEMLTGIRPMQTLMVRRPIREYDRSIPTKLEKIVTICTKRQMCERYPSMQQVKTELLTYHRKGTGRKLRASILQSINILLWGMVFLSVSVPLLQGIREDSFPFPFLIKPLILAGITLCYQFLLIHQKDKRRFLKKQEKNIFLTEKKFTGSYTVGLLLLVLLLFGNLPMEISHAGETGKELWVEMRDMQNRKLLLKKGTVYNPEERIRLDIPKEKLPEGTLSMQIVAVNASGDVWESRVFLVEGN